jgi:putrescine aminotransferase
MRPHGLLSLEEALRASPAESAAWFEQHVNPGLFSAYRWLGTHALGVESARGAELVLADGRTVVDFSSAFGVTLLGHAHPRVDQAEERFRRSGLPDAMKVGPHPLQGALAHSLAALLPDPLEVCFFATSGAEAVEAALKLTMRAGPRRSGRFITTRGAYHGKTAGALALTTAGEFREGFLLGIPREHVIEVEYGDLDALETALRGERARGGATAVVVESLQGQAVVEPPSGYLAGVIDLCRREGALSIFDEVKVGLLRTGTFTAFDAAGPVPDVLALGKGLGGGRHALAAMITSRVLFERAYGGRKGCALHTTTFGGLGAACAVGIEVLNVLSEPALVEHVRAQSRHLDAGLRALQARHLARVRSLRGRGLMRGIELEFDHGLLPRFVKSAGPGLFHTAQALYMASVVRVLLHEHGVLTHFCESDPGVLHLMPPLVVERAQIDRCTAALDDLLESGTVRTMTQLVAANLRERVLGA